MKTASLALLAFLSATSLAPLAWAEDPVGIWTGINRTTKGDRPMIMVVTRQSDGKLSARLESPTQAPGVPVPTENVESDGAKLSFTSPMVQGRYAATWDAETKAWIGWWTQNGVDMSLNWTRAS